MKLKEDHYHEICDRTYIIAENIETHIINSYEGDKFVIKKAKEALKIIHEIYQYAGAKF